MNFHLLLQLAIFPNTSADTVLGENLTLSVELTSGEESNSAFGLVSFFVDIEDSAVGVELSEFEFTLRDPDQVTFRRVDELRRNSSIIPSRLLVLNDSTNTSEQILNLRELEVMELGAISAGLSSLEGGVFSTSSQQIL